MNRIGVNNIGVIYKILNKEDGKFYIGSTSDFNKRKSRHIYNLRRNIHPNKYLQNDWNEFGEKAFEFTILEEVNNDCRLAKEQKYLNTLKPFGHKGYNISTNARNSFQTEQSCVICGDKFKTSSRYKKYCKSCLNGNFISDDEVNYALLDEEGKTLYSDYENYRDNNHWTHSKYELKNIRDWDVDDFIAADWDDRMSK